MNASIRQGNNSSGPPLFNWDGKNLRQSSITSGTPLFNVDGVISIAILIAYATGTI